LKHKTTLITTKTCSQHYFLLILVSSAPCNLQRRKDIRQTWGVDFALNPRWKTVFLVAQTRNKSVSDLLLKEENVFGDLVRAQYYDHYWNQTLKIQMAFEWAFMYCNFSFLLKLDDDTFVDIKGLISLLAKPATPQGKLYIGKCFKKAKVKRKGKWNISQSVNKSENPVLKHKTTLITTKTCSQHCFLFILVSSAPCNLQRRKDIRQTWGVDFALNPRWKTVFLVAQTRSKSVSDLLLKEENIFGDLVRAQYYDHYWNQTLKIQMAFEWAFMYCNFSFLLKMGGDTFVDVKGLISLLAKPATPQGELYIGKCFKKARVKRKGKWKILFEDYNATFYPEYYSGFGIVLSSDIIDKLVDLFDVVPKFKVDDVYIGMLAEKAGV
ncbi:unnamed protein product, partial [Porites evermanni]